MSNLRIQLKSKPRASSPQPRPPAKKPDAPTHANSKLKDQQSKSQPMKSKISKCRKCTSLKLDDQGKVRHAYYASWHHSVIRSIIGLDKFAGDFTLLAKRLSPPVTAAQARRSVELLERLGMVSRDSDGIYHIATAKHIKTGSEFTQIEKNRFHREFMKLAEEVLKDSPSPDRLISTEVVGISEESYRTICKETNDLKEKIRRLSEEERDADKVFLYQSILVPLAETTVK